MRHDLHDNVDYKQLFPPVAAVTDNTAQVSNIIDMQNAEAVEFVLVLGTLTDADATFAVTLEHGDDSALADTSVPAASDLIGTAALASFQFDSDNKCRKIGYKGIKRYFRMTVTPSANTGNLFMAGIAALARKSTPTSNPPT